MLYLLWQRRKSMFPLETPNLPIFFRYLFKDYHKFFFLPFNRSNLIIWVVNQPCLGGDSKTLMFVNISPDPSSANESLCSLRFAARVNACEIGTPRRLTNTRPWDLCSSYVFISANPLFDDETSEWFWLRLSCIAKEIWLY